MHLFTATKLILMVKHNYLAILVMVIASMVLGFAWYGFLFAEPWVWNAFHKTIPEMQASMKHDASEAIPYVVNIICMILTCFYASWLIVKLNIAGFMAGAIVGLYTSIGLVGPVIAIHYMFLMISKKVLLIDVSFSCVVTILIFGVLAAWRKK